MQKTHAGSQREHACDEHEQFPLWRHVGTGADERVPNLVGSSLEHVQSSTCSRESPQPDLTISLPQVLAKPKAKPTFRASAQKAKILPTSVAYLIAMTGIAGPSQATEPNGNDYGESRWEKAIRWIPVCLFVHGVPWCPILAIHPSICPSTHDFRSALCCPCTVRPSDVCTMY